MRAQLRPEDYVMSASDQRSEDAFYRSFIDHLVNKCRSTETFYTNKVRDGVWNQNATESRVPEAHQMNLLLADLSAHQRLVLAQMLSDAYSDGSFDVLVALSEEGVHPFDKAYEGDPYNDFIARLADWEWPVEQERR